MREICFLTIVIILTVNLTGCSNKPVVDNRHPPNILLIVLDAARADHFSSYGYNRPTTPNIDQVARDGIRFTRAISTSSWTLPSHASLFTGLLPDEHGTRNQHAWLIDRIPTLAELMKVRGYQTACFTNNPILDPVHNLVRGFNIIERVWADSTVTTESRPHNTEHTNNLVRSFVEENGDKPFFAFINYMDVHQPYTAPEPYRSMYLDAGRTITARIDSACRYAELLDNGTIKLNEKEKADLKAIYDGCLTYLDAMVENLLQGLRDTGVYDSTLIIITSDHGEVFGEKGKYGHGKFLFRSLIHIPLIIHHPALIPVPAVSDELVSITDIFYSLDDLLDLEGAAESGLPKRNLLSNKINNAPCYSSFTLGRSPTKLVDHKNDTHSVLTPDGLHYITRGNESIECFDLTKDFNEYNNLCPTKVNSREVVSIVNGVRENLERFVEDAQDLHATDNLTVDPIVLKTMRAIGYVGGPASGAESSNNSHLQKHPHLLEHIKTGFFFLSLDSLVSAENELRKALLMSENDIDARKALSFVLYRNNMFEEVVKTLQPIIRNTEDMKILLTMGLSLKNTGKTDGALEYFRKASDLEPKQLSAAMNAAELLMKHRSFDEADVYVQRIMMHHYGDQSALLSIISLYLNNDNPDAARDLILNQLKIAQSGTLYAILSQVYKMKGENSEASKCLKMSSKLGVSQIKFSQIKKHLNIGALEKR